MNQRSVEVVAILISNKVHLRTRNITRDKEGYYVMIKRSSSKRT